MKRLIVVALCASVLIPSTPTLAQVTFPPDVEAEFQSGVCTPQSALPAGHTASIEGREVEVGDEQLINTVVLLDIPGGIPVGSPTVVFTGTLRVNGGSPNIHGDFNITQEYTGGQSEVENTYETITTYRADCVVRNQNGQRTGQSQDDLEVERSSTRTETVTVNNPNYFQTTTEQRVVCISPNRNPGTWRNQNGYTGTCSRALYDSLVASPPPTNSLPTS